MGNSSSSSRNEGLVPAGVVYVDRYPLCRFCVYVRLLFGSITTFVIFWAALNVLIPAVHIPVGLYMLFIEIPVFLLEFGYAIRTCCGTDGLCCRCFSMILGLDGWSRGLLYMLFSIICLLPDTPLLSKIAGGLLIATGLLYFAKTFQKKALKTFVVDSAHSAPPSSSQDGSSSRNDSSYSSTAKREV